VPIAIALIAVTVTAAVTDIHSRRIPNWLTVSGFVLGVILNSALFGLGGLQSSLLGFGLAVLIHIPLFALRVTGGGDVKLMAATGAILGPQQWIQMFILAAIVGGIHALALVLFRRAMGGVLWNMAHMARAAVLTRMPYRLRPELDISASSALTIPRGLSVAIGSILYLWLE
jgi:prepilin peptidase CpaA